MGCALLSYKMCLLSNASVYDNNILCLVEVNTLFNRCIKIVLSTLPFDISWNIFPKCNKYVICLVAKIGLETIFPLDVIWCVYFINSSIKFLLYLQNAMYGKDKCIIIQFIEKRNCYINLLNISLFIFWGLLASVTAPKL